MLIATLPPVHREELMQKMLRNANVTELRYNTGMVSPFDPKETLERILAIKGSLNKPIWIDLKGRQLRIIEWAKPDYGTIRLNHNVTVEGAARAVFRDGVSCEIKFIRGNEIYLDGIPPEALGAGQSMNIHADHVDIEGYLTDTDREYIAAAKELGLNRFMLSFVENGSDIVEATDAFGNTDVKLGLKIESQKGIQFLTDLRLPEYCELVAARDDLFINIGEDKTSIIEILRTIRSFGRDPIVASRILKGVEANGRASLSDICDLELMWQIGYKRFMLSDELCHRHFEQAINEWQKFAFRFILTE